MTAQNNIDPAVADPGPLQGKTIVVTRPKDQGEEFAQILKSLGARVVFIPTIQITPPSSWDQCDAVIDTIHTYDGFIVTSVNAVRFFFRRLDERRGRTFRAALKNKAFYAVGSKTGEALSGEGMMPTVFSEVYDSRSLAEAVVKLPLRGKRLLFPKGNLADGEVSAELRTHGATVDEVVVYDTVAPRDKDAKFIRDSLVQETIDVITFFSPSSVRNLLTSVEREILASCVFAAIGSTTAEAFGEFGFKAGIVAPKPSAADLAQAIAQYYSAHRKN